MSTIALEVPETYDSITRPVTVSVMGDLINRLDLPNDTKIKYVGSGVTTAKKGSQLGKHNPLSSFPFTDQVSIEIEERYNEASVVSTAVQRYDNRYIFRDPNLLVSLKPVYTKTECVISLRYRAESRNAALRWRDSLRRKSTEGLQTMLHELVYHYSIPKVFEVILKEIHYRRENVAGYGDSFDEWITQHFDPRYTYLTNQSGSRALPVIPEKQIQVQGWLSYVTEPEQVEEENEAGSWSVGFDYTIRYDKPTSIVMDYPIIIHNQLLSEDYVSRETPYNPYDQPRAPSLSGYLNDQFSQINYSPRKAFEGIIIPAHDDWRPEGNNFQEVPLFTALIGVEADDPCQIVNLMELGTINITQPVLNFLFRHRQKIPHYLANIFHLTFYKGDMAMTSNTYYVDEDLNVRSYTPLDPRDVHHVRLALMTNPSSLFGKALTELREDPEVCIQVVDLIDGLQYNRLGMTQRVGAHALAETFRNNVNWNANNKRPGFVFQTQGGVSQKGDPTKIRSKPGNIQITQPVTTDWRPVQETARAIRKDPSFETYAEAVAAGVEVVAVKPMDANGRQDVLAVYEDRYLAFTVLHFLQGRLENLVVLSPVDFDEAMKDPDFVAVEDNEVVGEVLTTSGMVKPTTGNAGPRRLTSPARPGIQAPMLSDDLVVLGKKIVSQPSLKAVLSHLKPTINTTAVDQQRGMLTVMSAGIIAHRT